MDENNEKKTDNVEETIVEMNDEIEQESPKKKDSFFSVIIVVLAVALIGVIAFKNMGLFSKKTANVESGNIASSWKIEKDENLSCATVITKIYEDNDYIYSVPDSCVATGTYVVFSNGNKYTVKDAVNQGKVTIAELENAGVKIYKDAK